MLDYGHMKNFGAGCLVLYSSLSASAHEGTVDLTSGSVSCKGVSIYQDSITVYLVVVMVSYPYETTLQQVRPLG